MGKAAVLKIIGQFKDALEKKGIKIERIVLFGSYAAGKQREGSDIDLVVRSLLGSRLNNEHNLLPFYQSFRSCLSERHATKRFHNFLDAFFISISSANRRLMVETAA